MKRVLFIAYEFPPTGGAGVQRTTKFVKYLPSFGWQPTVLTVSNPSVPLLDDSLCDDIAPETSIVRCRTLEPGYRFKEAVSDSKSQPSLMKKAKALLKSAINCTLMPDPQILWSPAALVTGSRILCEVPHQAIIATGPPFSSLVIGRRLSRKFDLPLIVDYRDEWSISNKHRENRTTFGPGAWWQARQEEAVLRQCNAAIATTRSSASAIRGRCVQSKSTAKTFEIYNGYDPDDFAFDDDNATSNDEVFRISYVGTLWNLTDVGPLVRAVIQLCESAGHLSTKLELVFVGRRTPAQEATLDQLKYLPIQLVRMPYLQHRKAIELMKSSSLLCLLLSDSSESPRVVPAKLFEYRAANRPILAIAPKGEVWELLGDCLSSHCFEPHEISQIAMFLESQLSDFPNIEHSEPNNSSHYSRLAQTKVLADILNNVSIPEAIARVES